MRYRPLSIFLAALVILTGGLAPPGFAQTGSLAVGDVAQVKGVAPDPLNVRSQPGLSGAIVTTLDEGARVKLLEGPKSADGQSWWRVSLESNIFSLGWVTQTYLAPVSASPAPPTAAAPAASATPAAQTPAPATPAVASGPATGAALASPDKLAVGGGARVSGSGDGVNVRASPTTGATVLGTLQDGDVVSIVDGPESAGGYTWWKISTPGGLTGWSVGNWLKPAAPPSAEVAGTAGSAAPSLPAPGSPATLIKRNGAGFLVGPQAGYGFCVHMYLPDKQRVADLVKNAGFAWVKQQVEWRWHETAPGEYNFGELDAIVDTAAANNLGVVLSIVKAPTFYRAAGGDGPPDNPATLQRFMRELAGRYGNKVQGYEIWNEANLAVEWGIGKINAGEFVELLRAGYQGVKAGNPDAVVIMGALTPTGVNDWQLAADDVAYLRSMYAYQGGVVSKYFDALGAHPSGFNNPPDDSVNKSTKPVPGDTFKSHASFYFRRVEELYDVMKANGDGNKQVWLTEFGWSSQSSPPPGYEYAADVSEEEQARFLVRAYQKAKTEYPWMGVMALWNLNFQMIVGADDEKWGFGVVKADGSPRPAYTALANMPK